VVSLPPQYLYRESGGLAMKQLIRTVIHAGALRDAAGRAARPGVVAVEAGRVVAAGEPACLPSGFAERAMVVDRRDCLLLPAMVNAHTHLGLSAIGPMPYDPAGGFIGWVQSLRGVQPADEEAWRQAVTLGAQWSAAGGVQAVGDIAGDERFADWRAAAGLGGVSYLELFGLGPPFDRAGLAKMQGASQGLQPHAPYSAGPALYDAAARSGRPVSTHLAETREEHRFVAAGDGPWLDYLRQIGRWDDAFAAYYGRGLSPVQWMRPYLERAANDGGWLVAHCNHVDEDDIKLLADTNTSVAYCPLASEYFGHHRSGPGHRYRDMLDTGVNVCLGTDSIVGTNNDDPQPLGLLSAMCRLFQRDATDPDTLLAMATVNGARAMRMHDKTATLQPGAPARFACIPFDTDAPRDPLVQVLKGQHPVEAISFEM